VLFSGYMHQDAQEFFSYVINTCSEILEKEARAAAAARGRSGTASSSMGGSRGASPTSRGPGSSPKKLGVSNLGGDAANGSSSFSRHARSPSLQQLQAAAAAAQGDTAPMHTWVQDIFQGKMVNETRCLQCETGVWDPGELCSLLGGEGGCGNNVVQTQTAVEYY
jgi:hypothetical protein